MNKKTPAQYLALPEFKTMKHQVKIVNSTADVDAFALFWEMGVGKTCEEIMRYRWKCVKEDRLIKWLIVCPIIVMENWKREIAKFSKIPASQIQIVNGINPNSKAKKKVSSMAIKIKQFQTPNKTIFITNTETIQGYAQVKRIVNGRVRKILEEKEILKVMRAMEFRYITVDESHRFKNPTGIRSKTLHALGDGEQVKYKSILTGTPILNTPADIWSQYRFLSPGIFDNNFHSFQRKYFVDLNAGMPSDVHFPDWQINPGVVDELKKKVHSICNVVLKNEVLDLPPKKDIVVRIPLSKQQQRLYDEMARGMTSLLKTNKKIKIMPDTLDESLIEQLEDIGFNTSKVMSVDLAIVKGLRLQQIVSGIFTDDETGETTMLDNEADRVLEAMLYQHINLERAKKNKIIIWCVFKESYEVIAKICKRVLPKGMYCTFLTGVQDYDEKIINVDRINDDASFPVIIANQGAGGTGINLVGANKVYYYSRDFSLEKDLQSDARNHRAGQTRECERYDFVRYGTIDEVAFEALREKRKMARDILDVRSNSIFKDMNLRELFL